MELTQEIHGYSRPPKLGDHARTHLGADIIATLVRVSNHVFES